METDPDAQIGKEQKIKASLYFSIKQIAKEVEEEMEVSISAPVLATLCESLVRQAECYALDLENFAKHAKRTTINVDDVKLLARRNSAMLEHLNSLSEEQLAQKNVSKPSKKSTKSKQTTHDDLDN
ncbi:centromere protein S-like isoform X2 [Physella acuta]|nr:centromere protein S-like isoform X2 [Physella acuta]